MGFILPLLLIFPATLKHDPLLNCYLVPCLQVFCIPHPHLDLLHGVLFSFWLLLGLLFAAKFILLQLQGFISTFSTEKQLDQVMKAKAALLSITEHFSSRSKRVPPQKQMDPVWTAMPNCAQQILDFCNYLVDSQELR